MKIQFQSTREVSGLRTDVSILIEGVQELSEAKLLTILNELKGCLKFDDERETTSNLTQPLSPSYHQGKQNTCRYSPDKPCKYRQVEIETRESCRYPSVRPKY